MIRTTIIAITSLALVCAAADQRPVDDFPVAKLEYKDRSQLVHLHSPYGFVVKSESDGKPRFFVYDKNQANISVSTNLDAFLERLSKFPDGSEVAWINTCGAPLHYGLPAPILGKIQNALKAKKFLMAGINENNFVLCTCQATNLSFLTGTLPAQSH